MGKLHRLDAHQAAVSWALLRGCSAQGTGGDEDMPCPWRAQRCENICDEALRRHTGSLTAKVGRRSGKDQEDDTGAESLKDSGSLPRREVERRVP